MARPPSDHVNHVRQMLVARLNDGLHRPGDRFLSNRAIADQYGVSYQTADRLVRELVAAGLLERRPASGSYVPGKRVSLRGVQLIAHRRARRPQSFGARLIEELTARLDRERIDWAVTWSGDRAARVATDRYPIVWEDPAALQTLIRERRPALLLNHRPPAGLDSLFVDSVSVDDFSGGACAAQLLVGSRPQPLKLAVLSGPADDPRSMARVAGFTSIAKATVLSSHDWFFEGGSRVAGQVVASGRDGIFCCNDRLAEAIVRHCRENDRPTPPLVGFDDAPVALSLGLTTIAIPWAEMVSAAMAVIGRRLAGDTSTAAIAHIVATRPVIRRTTGK